MSGILARICADKRKHIAAQKALKPLAKLEDDARAAGAPRGFAQTLARAVDAGGTGLIAEIKRASPSKGLIRKEFDSSELAQAYAEGGATCLSVLTDAPFFKGADEHLTEAREAVELPVLRKDFLLDSYQVVESRAIGADCILVILAAVDDSAAAELMDLARQWRMDVLVEVHDAVELTRAKALRASLVGINNRDLKTLAVDLSNTERLAPHADSSAALVSESGIETAADLERMRRAGVHRVLAGTALMASPDVAAATAALLAPAPPQAVEG